MHCAVTDNIALVGELGAKGSESACVFTGFVLTKRPFHAIPKEQKGSHDQNTVCLELGQKEAF